MAVSLTSGDEAIIEATITQRNPGIFTDYYIRRDGGFTVYPGTPRHAVYLQHWADIGKKDFIASLCNIPYNVTGYKDDGEIYFREDRGYIPLPWHLDFFRAKPKERYIIGLAGSGKTMGMGILAMVMCAIIPNFKFMNVAPSKYQTEQMMNSIRDICQGTKFIDKFIKMKSGKWYTSKPLKIEFLNGSVAEFLNVDDNADNIQSSYGDWYNLDEAGLLSNITEHGTEALAQVALGITSRMRATAPDGRPRLGWMSWISNAYDCDTLWDRYEAGLLPNTIAYSRLVKHSDNPYLTKEQLTSIRRNAVLAGKEMQWMEGQRPQAPGAEISSKIVDPALDEEKFAVASRNAEDGIPGWRCEIGPGGIIYEEPPIGGHDYMISGDPGTGQAPDRNAPTMFVWDVTGFPDSKAEIVCVWWGNGGGSYMPFIEHFEDYVNRYRIPDIFRGYDSTGTQKAIAELSWESRGMNVNPLGFDGGKKWSYINALRLILSAGLIKAPKINAIRQQLVRYRLPDKKIAQDLVSALCMGAFMLYPLYRAAFPEFELPNAVQPGAFSLQRSRDDRTIYSRDSRAR